MESFLGFLLAALLLSLCPAPTAAGKPGAEKTRMPYIVHMAKHQMPESFEDHTLWYQSSLQSASPDAEVLYFYNAVAHGFSARMTAEEVRLLEARPGVLAVLPEAKYELHTTRTPQFLGLDRTAAAFPDAGTASEVIVGVLDTGVWPRLKSFDDAGFAAVPVDWKGACEAGTNFTALTCNRKLIGARFFARGYEAMLGPVDVTKESKSPLDDDGHGTHTATTAAGSAVQNANLLGYAEGVARGMATHARIAVYKVCWLGGCFSSDILAAMDKAVEDGVNVLSLSLGGGNTDYYRDSVAVGAFAAMEKGILVSCSAGNGGPAEYTLSNLAPWITTVGAGTLDRDFPAKLTVGNGRSYSGVSLYEGAPLPGTPIPFIHASNASNGPDGSRCLAGTLIPSMVAGKLVMCERGVSARVQKGVVVKAAGGVGMVLANTAANGEELVADAHLLPTLAVGERVGNELKSYVLSDAHPTANIHFEGTQVGIQPAPVVAAFSSRGPNSFTAEILKPDIIAPGVNILAGWTGKLGPTGLATDRRHVEFNIISGTSMSCPHVSGLAALLKAAHPDWSPAAVRSALMTTAYARYKTGQRIKDSATGLAATPYDYGAGHVDPGAALNPGLVYDLTTQDYLDFLCALKYTAKQINLVARRSFACNMSRRYGVSNLNYPSFAVPFRTAQVGGSIVGGRVRRPAVVKYRRTLTNVGPSPATYNVTVASESRAAKISVVPRSLRFSRLNEKKSYTVTFRGFSMPSSSSSFGSIEWADGRRVVRSPVAFTWS